MKQDYPGTGRLHDLFVTIEGMTPGEYKNGGEELSIHYSFGESLFGDYLVASTGKGICNLSFIENKKSALKTLKEQWYHAHIVEGDDANQEGVRKFFEHASRPDKIKLHLKGTPFQLKVWEALLKIPEGRLASYTDIANDIKKKNALQAVGNAIGNNPVGFIIPCHRVIKKQGAIGEYRWGSVRKSAIIGWEASRLAIAQ
jgi:AraC family transcriptional regulator of adaptative response/methylated-DNA-[protein]-cysteine methyltransferase